MKRFALCFFILMLPIAGTVLAGASPDKNTQVMTYELYTGGFRTLSTTLAIKNTPDEYQLSVNGRTVGILNIFTTWKGTMETQGKYMQDQRKSPLFHKTVSIWPHNTQIKKLSWNENGHLDDFYLLEEGETSGLDSIDKDMTENTVDIMTASLTLMQNVAQIGSCDIESKVFDGKRSFLLRGVNKGQEVLHPSKYNVYDGEAIKCEIQIIPQDGNWHEKLRGWMSIQEQSHEAGTRPLVWLAQLKPEGVAVPVKMKANTSYGVFMMHLKSFR